MRLFNLCILILVIALLPGTASSKKAETIDELVEMYDIKSCADCHEDKYNEWKTSTMGNSVADPRVLRGMRTFIRLALDQEKTLGRGDLTICLNCHVPQIKDATPELVLRIGDLVLTAVEDKDETKREAARKELAKLNLNCLGCHNLSATGPKSQPKEKMIYGPRRLEDNPHEEIGFQTAKSDLLPASEFCAGCHHCPPDVPWKECPTLYTSYMEDFVHKGHKESCQDCHMQGEKLSHKFLGPNNPDFLKSSVSLSVNARPTHYIDIYENKKIPVVVVKTELTNNAGHVIPHGCAVTPRMHMDVTVRDQDGREIFSNRKEFTVGDLYFKGGKQVAMAEWDVTATEHVELGLKPNAPDTNTFVVPLRADTTSAIIEVTVNYLYTRDETFTMQKVTQKVEIEK
ncbi:MAG: hypothetical protein HZB61_07270 [Nitrospirae bacterium]|nr:hypothetical protein [Nitrospirota bacterium]